MKCTQCSSNADAYEMADDVMCPNCLLVDNKRLREELSTLANQALIVLQLDFDYSPELLCTYGDHPIRHMLLWDQSVRVLSGRIPNVEDTRARKNERREKSK